MAFLSIAETSPFMTESDYGEMGTMFNTGRFNSSTWPTVPVHPIPTTTGTTLNQYKNIWSNREYGPRYSIDEYWHDELLKRPHSPNSVIIPLDYPDSPVVSILNPFASSKKSLYPSNNDLFSPSVEILSVDIPFLHDVKVVLNLDVTNVFSSRNRVPISIEISFGAPIATSSGQALIDIKSSFGSDFRRVTTDRSNAIPRLIDSIELFEESPHLCKGTFRLNEQAIDSLHVNIQSILNFGNLTTTYPIKDMIREQLKGLLCKTLSFPVGKNDLPDPKPSPSLDSSAGSKEPVQLRLDF